MCGKKFDIPSQHSLMFVDQLAGLPNEADLERELLTALGLSAEEWRALRAPFQGRQLRGGGSAVAGRSRGKSPAHARTIRALVRRP